MKRHPKIIGQFLGVFPGIFSGVFLGLFPRLFLGLLLGLFLLSSCGSYPISREWQLPDPREVPTDPKGAIIRIEGTLGGERTFDLEGEYLGMASDSEIIVGTPQGNYSVPPRLATDAVIVLHSNVSHEFSGATAGLTILTLSHGWFLILTAPATLLAGSLCTGSESDNGRTSAEVIRGRVDHRWWLKTALYSRYPQGVPKMAFAPFKSVQ